MIPHVSSLRRSSEALDRVAQDRFLQMLPGIRRVANFAFRRSGAMERQERIADVIAHALEVFSRLVARGKAELAFPSVLGWLGVRRVLDDRRVGTRRNITDVSSAHCQRRTGARITPLCEFDPAKGKWEEVVVEDRRATPADVVAARLDIAAWLRQLPRLHRDVAKVLAIGERTSDAAKRFQVSQARISQLRRELQSSWNRFQGEVAPVAV
jgi:hypothetical protein